MRLCGHNINKKVYLAIVISSKIKILLPNNLKEFNIKKNSR
jgi:hypothetical protein